jgi:hypothetical protein
MSATALGLFAIGLPALIVGGLLLMYWPMVQRGFVVVLAAALVYLGLSGIAADVGNRVSVHLPNGVILADAPPVAPPPAAPSSTAPPAAQQDAPSK